MDDPNILISIAGIVATGSLSKVGVNITESVIYKTDQLFSYIQYIAIPTSMRYT